MKRTLLLVTGAGRSGTSTAAGAMALLGLHVPGPFLGANPTNPKGFYESKWSVDFHNRLLKRAAVSIADGRPEAGQRLLDAVRDTDRAELRDTLQVLTDGHPVSVLKETYQVAQFDLIVSDVRPGTKLDFLDLHLFLILLGRLLLFIDLENKLAIVHYPADRRIRTWRDLHQIKLGFNGKLLSFFR